MLKHLQFLIQAVTKDYPKPHEESFMNGQLCDLVANINMKEVIAPRSVYVASPGNEGMTGQIGIETSHIAYHVWDKVHVDALTLTYGSMMSAIDGRSLWQMDLYTCGCLSLSDLEHIKTFLRPFGFQAMHYLLIDRENGFKKLNEGFIYETIDSNKAFL